jgi:xanthine dehydrogenase YagR molybdenum-binding subunit
MRALAVEESDGHFPARERGYSNRQVHFVDEFDAHASPTDARGIGELGATGVATAVANAAYDAVGIRIRDLPITPARLLSG